MSEKLKIIANPSVHQIGLGLFGMLFFLSIGCYIYNPEWMLKERSDSIIMWVLVVLFFLFALLAFYLLLFLKKVIVTNESLTISHPLLFHTRSINFNEVKSVVEDDFIIKIRRKFARNEIYNGKKMTIELFDSKKIIITSFEVMNYDSLAKNMKNCTSLYFK